MDKGNDASLAFGLKTGGGVPLSEIEIFCPNCQHFIGLRTQCDACHWVRPGQASSAVGQLCWNVRVFEPDNLTDSSVFLTQISSCSGMLIVPTEEGYVAALDPDNGQLKWIRSLHPEGKLRVQAASAWNNLLLLGGQNLADLPSYDRRLAAWQAENGEEEWHWPTGADNLSIPVVDQDMAYFTSSEPMVYALDLQERRLRWSAASQNWSPEPPGISGGVIVVPARGPFVAAYRASDGQNMWTFAADDKEGELLHHRPAVSGGTAFLSGWGKRLYAVDLETGSLRWRFSSRRGITCPPVVAGDKVLVAVKDVRAAGDEVKPSYGLTALDSRSGEVVWSFQTDRHIYSLPVVVENKVMFGADDKRFHVLDLDSGSEIWQFSGDDKLRVSPLVMGERVFVGQRDGKIYCLQWKETQPVWQDPADLLAQGKQIEAAEALALAGRYEESARLYAQHGLMPQAAALFYEAGLLSDAAEIYTRLNDLTTALALRRQSGDRAGEAATLSLLGSHNEAALILEEAGNLNLAVQEYILAGRGGYAAMLLRKKGRLEEAAELFSLVNQEDQAAEVLVEGECFAEAAEIYLRLGKPEVAASVLAQGGLLERAAVINAQLGQHQLAAEQFAQAGQMTEALRLYEKLEDWSQVAALAEQLNDLPRKAAALDRLGQWEQSAELHQRAGQLEKALELYEAHSRWEKVAVLAGELARWAQQARAFSQMGLITQAGEAFEKAALDLHSKDPQAEKQIADLYEEAAKCFAEDDDWVRQAACYDRVCRYRTWPNLKVYFEPGAQFYQAEYSLISLEIQNIGYSPAQNIQVSSVSQKFRVDEHESEISIRILGVQQDRTLRLSLQPRPDVLGQVLLRATLTYEDRSGGAHQATVEQSVKVLGRDEKVSLGAITPRETVVGRDPISDSRINEEVIRLTRGLVEYFNDEELQDLCFGYLQMEYEDLRGETKSSRVRELVLLMRRHGRLAELKEALRLLRPHITW